MKRFLPVIFLLAYSSNALCSSNPDTTTAQIVNAFDIAQNALLQKEQALQIDPNGKESQEIFKNLINELQNILMYASYCKNFKPYTEPILTLLKNQNLETMSAEESQMLGLQIVLQLSTMAGNIPQNNGVPSYKATANILVNNPGEIAPQLTYLVLALMRTMAIWVEAIADDKNIPIPNTIQEIFNGLKMLKNPATSTVQEVEKGLQKINLLGLITNKEKISEVIAFYTAIQNASQNLDTQQIPAPTTENTEIITDTTQAQPTKNEPVTDDVIVATDDAVNTDAQPAN